MANRKRRNGKAPAGGGGEFSLISNEKLLALYSGLLACRAIGVRRRTNGRSASICVHEAALVGATIDLGAGDTVCSREHGVFTGFSDGTAIPTLLLQPGNHAQGTRTGKAAHKAGLNGASRSAGPAYTHAAIGTALANKTRTNRKVAVVFSNEDSREALREAVHTATMHALPMVFVHQSEDDRGELAVRKRERSKREPSRLETPWFPSITVDCHDVVALYRVAFEAISRARLGRGPTLIECQPFRVKNGNGAHAEDPILHMEHYLRAKGLPVPGESRGFSPAVARRPRRLRRFL